MAAVWTLTRVQRLIRRPAGDPAGLVAGTMTGLAQFHLNLTLGGLGVPGAPALTAVLVYRGITFWLAIVIGWLLYWRLRRNRAVTVA